MKKNLHIIKQSNLFSGISLEELATTLTCLSATVLDYKKGEAIFRAGDTNSSIGVVLNGIVHIVKEDYWGNRNILTEILKRQIFGETYACAVHIPMEVSAIAVQDCTILFLDIRRIITMCSNACSVHTRVIQNLIMILAHKNMTLTSKIEHMTQRTTRSKLLSYLSEQSFKGGNTSFAIPFNRQQLADYLSVDRSALSSELGKLRDEGMLTFTKNNFELL